MKRYLIAVGVVLAMLVSAAPAAAAEPGVPMDAYGLPHRNTDSIHKFIWFFQGDSKVEQSNDNKSGDATAVNYNTTDQANEQKQFGAGGDAASGPASSDGSATWCGKDGPRNPRSHEKAHDHEKVDRCGDGATTGKAVGGDVDQGQTAENSNSTRQNASAESKAYQVAPINVNAPIRVLSHGDDSVEQSNDNESGDAMAVNKNSTEQSNDHAQYGFGGDAESGEATSEDGSERSDKCGCFGEGGDASTGDAYGGDVDQGQDASNADRTEQNAEAESKAMQIAPINVNAPIRLLSHGDSEVEQSNDNESGDATAVNANNTDQSNDQTQVGLGGDAESGAATSSDGSDECGCRSEGGDASTGDAYGGDVRQSQDASNSNGTAQNAEASSSATQVLPINGNLLGGGLLGGPG